MFHDSPEELSPRDPLWARVLESGVEVVAYIIKRKSKAERITKERKKERKKKESSRFVLYKRAALTARVSGEFRTPKKHIIALFQNCDI